MIATQRLLLLLPLTFLLFFPQTSAKPFYRYTLILLMIACFLHLCLMLYAGAPRYEAALVGCSVIICCTLVVKYTTISGIRSITGKAWVKVIVGCFVVAPLFLRSWYGFGRASLAAISIYDQQVQMGHFVHQYYDHDAIAFNDIGAVSYFAHGNNLDLWGLGDITVARRRKKHQDTPAFLDSLSRSRKVKIAILFQEPFYNLLQRWTKVASWTIPYNNASYSKSVFFYAVDSTDAPALASNLKKYQPSLPEGVVVKYY
jgi:energy-coupling factor transporter transmembrane protein EcfT